MFAALRVACVAVVGIVSFPSIATEAKPTPEEAPSLVQGDVGSLSRERRPEGVSRAYAIGATDAATEGGPGGDVNSPAKGGAVAWLAMDRGAAPGDVVDTATPPSKDVGENALADAIVEREEPPSVPALTTEKGAAPLIAVLDLKASEGSAGLASALATVITAELNARDDVRAVSRSEIQAILAHKADQALLGCESVKCAADLGKLVEADLVIVGSIEQVSAAYVFSLSLIDPVVPAVKERVEATWRSGPDEIVILARPYVDRLLGGANAGSYVGALDVLAPEGAKVFVDGREIGTAPLSSPLPGLPIGVHVLEVAQGGHYTSTRDVVITRGETTVVRVELEEQPFWTRWWFWTASGGAATVAIASGTALAMYLSAQSESAPPPTTLKVRTGLPAELQ